MKKLYFIMIPVWFFPVLLFIFSVGCEMPSPKVSAAHPKKTIIDMVGRRVLIPQEVNTALGTSPISTMLVYMLSPDKLAGWYARPGRKFVNAKYQDIPVVGGWFGKQTGNYENFLAIGPDVVFEEYRSGSDSLLKIRERQKKLGNIPLVALVHASEPDGFEAPIRFMGSILNEEKKAETLISFYRQALDDVVPKVAQIPLYEKKRVYYAEGITGLYTDPQGSMHTRLIELCGGINVAVCPLKAGYGMSEVSVEQVMLWNPDVIIARAPGFFDFVRSDPRWKNIHAVQNSGVYPVPCGPFSWFDRPPGMNQILGIYWMAKTLYPHKFKDLDIGQKVKYFYTRFYHYDLKDEEIIQILSPGKRR